MPIAGLDSLETIIMLVMIVSVAGALLPLLPGPLLAWGAALAYNLIRGFTLQSGIFFAVMTVLMLAGSTADLWLGSLGAKKGGASGCSAVLALIAGVVGLIFFSVIGAILLPTLTVLVVELIRLRDVRQAVKAGGGYLAGWLLSALVELVTVLAIIGLWLWQIGYFTRAGA